MGMNMLILFNIMTDWMSPLLKDDKDYPFSWILKKDDTDEEFYWHCCDEKHEYAGAEVGAYVVKDENNDSASVIKLYIDSRDCVIATIKMWAETVIIASRSTYQKSEHHFPIDKIQDLYKAITKNMAHPQVIIDMGGIDSTNCLIYSPDRYIVGDVYSLRRIISHNPYTPETINGILKAYSETTLTFTTTKGDITLSAKDFDDDSKWYVDAGVSIKGSYTMYGLSINESIVDNNFVVGNLYIIKDKWYGADRTWHGIYLGHKLNNWGWLDLKFRNVTWKNPSFKCPDVFEMEVDICKIIRKEATIYSIEGIKEIKII